MESSIAERLKGRGLDIDFLLWLEGEADRLPKWGAVRKLKSDQLVAAIRAAVWLRQLDSDPDVIGPTSPEAWESRYSLLEVYLLDVVKSTFFFSLLKRHDDLEALEHVLLTLLPKSSSDVYRADFLRLRRKGYPETLPFSRDDIRPRRSGGKPKSEQTDRMRAAVAYLRTVSERPFEDLAEFWNECSGREDVGYDPAAIRSRLRKGNPMDLRAGAAERFFKYWKCVYDGDLIFVSPAPFPLSPELRRAYERKRGPSEA